MRIDLEVVFCVSDGLLRFTFIKTGLCTQMMTDEDSWSVNHQPFFFLKRRRVVFQLWGIGPAALWAKWTFPYSLFKSSLSLYSHALTQTHTLQHKRLRRIGVNTRHTYIEGTRFDCTHSPDTHTHTFLHSAGPTVYCQNPTSLHAFHIFSFMFSSLFPSHAACSVLSMKIILLSVCLYMFLSIGFTRGRFFFLCVQPLSVTSVSAVDINTYSGGDI